MWKKIIDVQYEHRVFTREGRSGYCIADRSGKTPSDTEDGPLWVDEVKVRDLGYIVVVERAHAGIVAHVPVYDADGETSVAVMSLLVAAQLAYLIRVPLRLAIKGNSTLRTRPNVLSSIDLTSSQPCLYVVNMDTCEVVPAAPEDEGTTWGVARRHAVAELKHRIAGHEHALAQMKSQRARLIRTPNPQHEED